MCSVTRPASGRSAPPLHQSNGRGTSGAAAGAARGRGLCSAGVPRKQTRHRRRCFRRQATVRPRTKSCRSGAGAPEPGRPRRCLCRSVTVFATGRAPHSANSRAASTATWHRRAPCFAGSPGKTVPRPAMRGQQGAGGFRSERRQPLPGRAVLLARRRGDAGWGHAPALLWTRYFATKMEALSRVDGFACWSRIVALLRAVGLACSCVAGLVTNLRLAGVNG